MWRKVLGEAAGAVDRAVVAAMHVRSARDRARADRMSHAERLEALEAIHRAYGGGALVADASRFFPEPPPIEPVARAVGEGVLELSWSSAFAPWLSDVAERYLSAVENRTARARLHTARSRGGTTRAGRRRARPALIALPGYMGGFFRLDEPQWPLPWLLRRGLDVAMLVLPFHGPRAGARRGAPPFPSSDPRLTNEGFRQAVADVRTLARWLRAEGAPHVGLVGMSLGGYTSALVATVSDDVDFVMPMVPLASIARYALEQGRLGEGPEAEAQERALERANVVVSPLSRPLRLPPARALVIGAAYDQVTPSSHARRLAEHFGCELVEIPGGHLLQFGRDAAFRGLEAMLEREGLIAPRPARPRG